MAIENLGGYGEFTKAAKAAGGVEKHVANIESAAAIKAAPGWILLGAGLGVIGVKVKQWNDRRLEKARRALMEEIDETRGLDPESRHR